MTGAGGDQRQASRQRVGGDAMLATGGVMAEDVDASH